MGDLFKEIAESLRRNKLRTALTGFSVSWGIFMIIVLLGAGNGLMNAFMRNSADVTTNTMEVQGWRTSIPYDGLKSGRRIELEDKDRAITMSALFSENIDQVSTTLSQSGSTVVFGKRTMSGNLLGIYPEYAGMNNLSIVAGRSIDKADIDACRKVAVISSAHARNLSDGSSDYESWPGRRIKVGNLSYLVVGVYQGRGDALWEDMYVPFTTLRLIYKKGNELENITFTFHGLNSVAENEEFENRYRAAINSNHRASPEDRSAIWIWNRYTQDLQMQNATRILSLALWIIGLFTLLSGIVGVSNIMLITVKERTHEFGIRKAIGAPPWQIIKLILAESVSVTAIFGYVGMILGLVACEVLDKTVGSKGVEMFGETMNMLKDPFVGVDVAVEATLLLIVAGTIAGLFPALKASRTKPIEALRAE